MNTSSTSLPAIDTSIGVDSQQNFYIKESYKIRWIEHRLTEVKINSPENTWRTYDTEKVTYKRLYIYNIYKYMQLIQCFYKNA